MPSHATVKAFWRGTHRVVSPGETLSRVAGAASALGLTRVANVTGLDYLSIPVFIAVRPNARSLSVSQGKGLDAKCAAASAVMEALELAHAERATLRRVSASYASLRERAADPASLPHLRGVPLAREQKITWVEGVDLVNGSKIFVPFDLVDCRFDRRRGAAEVFLRTSNGLASGNVWLEAVCAGICEVIERDATSLWALRNAAQKQERRLNLATVSDDDCRTLLDDIGARGMSVALWDVTTDVGVSCLLCRISEAAGNQRSALGAFLGAGCHLSREVALVRAVTEAAQARLTYIAGSRDDLYCRDYEKAEAPGVAAMLEDEWRREQAVRSFESMPSNAGETFEEDLAQLVSRLRAAGLERVIAVDLTDDRFGIPVVRIIVPGLEAHDEHNRQRPGRRALAMAKALQ